MTIKSACGDPTIFPGIYNGNTTYGNITAAAAAGMGGAIGNVGGTWTTTINYPTSEDFKKIEDRIEGIEKRLAIINPNEVLMARYPALQEAYDHYKLIEKMVNEKA